MRHEHCDNETLEASETSTLCVEKEQNSALASEAMSAVETGQIFAFVTGPRSGSATGQMPSVERREPSGLATGSS